MGAGKVIAIIGASISLASLFLSFFYPNGLVGGEFQYQMDLQP